MVVCSGILQGSHDVVVPNIYRLLSLEYDGQEDSTIHLAISSSVLDLLLEMSVLIISLVKHCVKTDHCSPKLLPILVSLNSVCCT